jgi:hypothetical protein
MRGGLGDDYMYLTVEMATYHEDLEPEEHRRHVLIPRISVRDFT